MADERLLDFPSKAVASPSDIVYCGNSAAADIEVQITVAGLIGAYPGLLSIGELTTAANQIIYTTDVDTYATAPISAFGLSLVADANASDGRSTLGVVIGTDVQAYSAALASIAGLTTTADEMIYTTGANTYAVTALTSAARTLLGEATTGDMLTYLAALPLAGGTMAGNINMNSFKCTNGAEPVDPADYATKNYVDNVATGLTAQPAVYAATTANLAGYTYNNGVLGVGATLTAGSNGAFSLDGTSPALNSRILVKNESTAAQNGIYTLTQVGDGSNPAILTRATDYDSPSEIQPGDFVIVNNGTVNAGFAYVQTATVAVIGTDAINFSQFGGQFALKGANSDITSMTGLTGVLQAPTGISSSAGLSLLTFSYTASAVNYLTITNSATGLSPSITATGSDAAVNLNLISKGGGFRLKDSTNVGGAYLTFVNAAGTFATTIGVAAAQASNANFNLPAADGSANFVMKTDGAGNLSFVQQNLRQFISTTVSVTSGTTVIPFDNTTPQNTEGFSIGSLAITPKSATNILEITCIANCNCVGAAQAYVLALFQDSNASALKSSMALSAANGGHSLLLKYTMVAGTTSSTTFSFRLGGNSTTSVTVGGYNGAGILNGTSNGLITITETAP